MTIKTRLGRIAAGLGLGPGWVKRAYQDERSMQLLLAFVLATDSNCIDVGSHEGRVLAEMVRLAPSGRHIAYEPLPGLYDKLKVNFPRVDVRNAALSDRNGSSTFVHVTNMAAYSGFQRRAYPGKANIETITVRTEKLDAHLPSDYVPTLIKIDVEGAELLVLEGAIETLKRFRPVVIFEHGKGASDHYGTRPSHVFSLLCESARLRIFDLDGNGPYDLTRFETTYHRNDRWNFVAHA